MIYTIFAYLYSWLNSVCLHYKVILSGRNKYEADQNLNKKVYTKKICGKNVIYLELIILKVIWIHQKYYLKYYYNKNKFGYIISSGYKY